jgi:hypothetical protein
VLHFAGADDHKKLMPRNLMGILGAAKGCLIEISGKKNVRKTHFRKTIIAKKKAIALRKQTYIFVD